MKLKDFKHKQTHCFCGNKYEIADTEYFKHKMGFRFSHVCNKCNYVVYGDNQDESFENGWLLTEEGYGSQPNFDMYVDGVYMYDDDDFSNQYVFKCDSLEEIIKIAKRYNDVKILL